MHSHTLLKPLDCCKISHCKIVLCAMNVVDAFDSICISTNRFLACTPNSMYMYCVSVIEVTPSSPSRSGPVASRHVWRRADTNVLTIRFDQLTAPANMHTGDIIHCQSCRAVLSRLSKVTKLPEPDPDTGKTQVRTIVIFLTQNLRQCLLN